MNRSNAVTSVSALWVFAVLGALLAFFFQVIAARILAPKYYGELYVALSVVGFFAPLAGFGVHSYMLKLFGEGQEQAGKSLHALFCFLLVSVACSVCIVVLAGGVNGGEFGLMLVIASTLVPIQVLVDVVGAQLQVERRYPILALWQFLPHVIRFTAVLCLFLAGLKYEAWTVVASIAVALVIVIVPIGLRALLKFYSINKSYDTQTVGIRDIFNETRPFGLSVIFHLFYFQTSAVILKYTVGSEASGLYGIAFTFILSLYILPNVIYQKYLIPKLHVLVYENFSLFVCYYKLGNIAMLLLGLVVTTVMFFMAPLFIGLFFGEAYLGAVFVLEIMLLGVPLRFLSCNSGAVLMTKDYMAVKMKCMAVMAVIGLIVNFFAIINYGIIGAAAATVANELLLFLLFLGAVKKNVLVTSEGGK